jgi:hypothetical protein
MADEVEQVGSEKTTEPEPEPEQRARVGQSDVSAEEAARIAAEVTGTSRLVDEPLAMFVKDGTSTTASERLYDQGYREAEQRRKEADRDRAIARKPIEQGGGRMYTHQMTSRPDIPRAFVLLRYANEQGSPMPPGECLANVLIENWSRPHDLTLVIMCPRCWLGGQKHAQDCQLFIRMSNRNWEFVPASGPKTFKFDDGGGPKMYSSAGVVAESEIFHCKDCSWAARIVNNVIRTER